MNCLKFTLMSSSYLDYYNLYWSYSLHFKASVHGVLSTAEKSVIPIWYINRRFPGDE